MKLLLAIVAVVVVIIIVKLASDHMKCRHLPLKDHVRCHLGQTEHHRTGPYEDWGLYGYHEKPTQIHKIIKFGIPVDGIVADSRHTFRLGDTLQSCDLCPNCTVCPDCPKCKKTKA